MVWYIQMLSLGFLVACTVVLQVANNVCAFALVSLHEAMTGPISILLCVNVYVRATEGADM